MNNGAVKITKQVAFKKNNLRGDFVFCALSVDQGFLNVSRVIWIPAFRVVTLILPFLAVELSLAMMEKFAWKRDFSRLNLHRLPRRRRVELHATLRPQKHQAHRNQTCLLFQKMHPSRQVIRK